MADRYHGNYGYTPFITDDLASGEWKQLSPEEYDLGNRKKRHGGILEIQDNVADMLTKHYKL
jgi:hypothetical protein